MLGTPVDGAAASATAAGWVAGSGHWNDRQREGSCGVVQGGGGWMANAVVACLLWQLGVWCGSCQRYGSLYRGRLCLH